jgi:hypothetical protein
MFAKLAQIRLRGIGSAKQALATNKYGIGNRATCGSPIAPIMLGGPSLSAIGRKHR